MEEEGRNKRSRQIETEGGNEIRLEPKITRVKWSEGPLGFRRASLLLLLIPNSHLNCKSKIVFIFLGGLIDSLSCTHIPTIVFGKQSSTSYPQYQISRLAERSLWQPTGTRMRCIEVRKLNTKSSMQWRGCFFLTGPPIEYHKFQPVSKFQYLELFPISTGWFFPHWYPPQSSKCQIT